MVRVAIALLLMVLVPSAAHAEKRIALLIGNQSYSAEIGRLANPHNDVALLGQALKGLGFEVTTVSGCRACGSAPGRQRARAPRAGGGAECGRLLLLLRPWRSRMAAPTT